MITKSSKGQAAGSFGHYPAALPASELFVIRGITDIILQKETFKTMPKYSVVFESNEEIYGIVPKAYDWVHYKSKLKVKDSGLSQGTCKFGMNLGSCSPVRGRSGSMSDKQSVLSYSEARSYYDHFGKKQDAQGFYEDPALDDLIAHGCFQDAQKVFEFGCGTGKFAARLLAEHLPPYIDQERWQFEHRRVVTPCGVPSEVLILSPKITADKTLPQTGPSATGR